MEYIVNKTVKSLEERENEIIRFVWAGPVLVGNGIRWNHLLAFISNFRPQTHILVLLYYPAFPILDPHTPIFCILVPNVLSCKKTQKTRTHGGSGRHRCRVFDSVPPPPGFMTLNVYLVLFFACVYMFLL